MSPKSAGPREWTLHELTGRVLSGGLSTVPLRYIEATAETRAASEMRALLENSLRLLDINLEYNRGKVSSAIRELLERIAKGEK